VRTWTKDEQWSAIAVERARLVADTGGLRPDQWRTASQCGEWTVEETMAHLTAAASIGRVRWMRSVLGARFDFDLHNRRRLDEHLGSSPEDTRQRFERTVGNRVGASGAVWAWLGEVIVHATDIRVPLHIDSDPDLESVVFVAGHYAAKDFAVPSQSTVKDLRLEATDSDFVSGTGPTVTGRTLDLVMVMAGRGRHLQHLTGDGVPYLARRVGPNTG